MGTRLGAQAMHLGDITGSLEVGKRADLILVDINKIHNSPRFQRDPDNAYASIVYAGKSTDVTDVMVNGKWVMQDQKLLNLDEKELLYQASQYAHKIDSFLTKREQSVFSKLIALGGSSEAESFEIQIKVEVPDIESIKTAVENGELEIIYFKHYHQHDAYFSFEDTSQGRLRYREDELLDHKEEIKSARSRLTLIGQDRENNFEKDVLLSRSRYLAPATNSLRFYSEYFKPSREILVDKDRLRWLVKYKETEFYINLDEFINPDIGCFLEVKSRTWSKLDAENKARLTSELIILLGGSLDKTLTKDYIDFIQVQSVR